MLVAGAGADALFVVDVDARSVRRIAFPKGSYPSFVAAAPDGKTFAAADDGDDVVRIGTLDAIAQGSPTPIGGHPGGLAFSSDGTQLFATVQSKSAIADVDVATGRPTFFPTGLHPAAVAVSADKMYVAESDADDLAIYDSRDVHLLARIPLGDTTAPDGVSGVSPNALALDGDTVYVTLGAANSVAVVRGGQLAGRMEAGWYPTDAVPLGAHLYVLDGKGEGARPNPGYHYGTHDPTDYVAAIEFGSLRAYDLPGDGDLAGSPQGSQGWNGAAPGTVVRPGGPIRHVFFVLKENRTYDQVLGDMPAGNGDAQLAWFGARVTPNEHAISTRFGLFDNAYANGEVSSPGHMWADAAFANDYLERLWPAIYAGRRDPDRLDVGDGPFLPSGGYIWDAARRANVSFLDYGELVNPGPKLGSPGVAATPTLAGRFDPQYVGWNLDYSDLDRVKEWRRDFEARVEAGTLPQFEFIWLPNDHTYGSKAGKLAPSSYVAINDYALAQMIETLSHSSVWSSSAMFVTEDDAQDGADHVSDQRTTLYVISPYATGGVHHEHYSTVGVLRTIETILGMRPVSTYDAMAVPLFAAFGTTPDLRPYDAIAPQIDVTHRNSAKAYGAKTSAHLDFTRPDAVPPGVLENIIAHNH